NCHSILFLPAPPTFSGSTYPSTHATGRTAEAPACPWCTSFSEIAQTAHISPFLLTAHSGLLLRGESTSHLVVWHSDANTGPFEKVEGQP
ncbi:hypothetical protein WG66_016573, partial [Moniliophthora roreri]